MHGLIALQKKIDKQTIRAAPWYRKGKSEPVPIPVLGPDLIDSRVLDILHDEKSKRDKE